jgi:hypothetical protein
MSNLVDRALWAWAWYVRFYKGVIYFVLAWWLWPIVLFALFLPFILLKVWWSGSVFEPAAIASPPDARVGAIHEAQSLVAQVSAEAHDLLQRIHALRPHADQALWAEKADSLSGWKRHRDFDPEPIIAAGAERLVALEAAQRRHEANRTDPLAQTQIDREVERTRSWAAAHTAHLQEISSSLKLIEQALFDRQALSDTP